MTTKYEERTTKAVAIVMNLETLQGEEKTVEIPYTRVINDKTTKAVAKVLNVPANTVLVKDLMQTEWRTVEPAAGQIINISEQHDLLEPVEAGEGKTCVSYTTYEYIGFAFGYWTDENGLTPGGVALDIFTTEKLGKNNARGLLHNEASEHFDQLFAVDYKTRKEVKRYAVVNSAEYQALRREAAKAENKQRI